MSIARPAAGLALALVLCVSVRGAPEQKPKTYTFKVNARTNAATTPLKTGIKVVKGQRILIEPNPNDKWNDGSSSLNYKGRVKSPHMYLEWGINESKGGPSRVKEDKFEVVADKDGEVILCCGDRIGTKNNSGDIRVTVTLLPPK